MREEFEKWAAQSSADPLLIRADYNGKELDEYHFPMARGMWETWQAATALQAERVRELEDKVQMLASLLNEHVANDQLNWDEDEWIERAAKAIYEIPFDGDSEVEQALSATAREVGDE